MILDEKIILTSDEWCHVKKWLGDYVKVCDVISDRNQGTSDGYKACQTSEEVKIFIRK